MRRRGRGMRRKFATRQASWSAPSLREPSVMERPRGVALVDQCSALLCEGRLDDLQADQVDLSPSHAAREGRPVVAGHRWSRLPDLSARDVMWAGEDAGEGAIRASRLAANLPPALSSAAQGCRPLSDIGHRNPSPDGLSTVVMRRHATDKSNQMETASLLRAARRVYRILGGRLYCVRVRWPEGRS